MSKSLKRAAVVVALVASTVVGTSSVVSANKEGGVCKKAGTKTGIPGGTLVCTRVASGKNKVKLVWTRMSSGSGSGSSGSSSGGSSGSSGSGSAESGGNSTSTVVLWNNDGNGGWSASGKAPTCTGVVWSLFVDSLTGVQAVLDPGQVRGGRYKAHGGLRLAESDVVVRSPIDGYIVSAAAYRETATGSPGPDGELQYLVDIQNPCGLAVRFDHLRVLDPSVARALSTVAVRDDSQTTRLIPPIRISRGQVLATSVGHVTTSFNPSFDFGAYDYRARQYNRRSENELRAFGPDGLLGLHALCWQDLFGAATSAALRAIPRTTTEASQGSDVCR